MYIPVSSDPTPFQLMSLGADSPVVILIRPTTPEDFSKLGNELFRHNIVPMSQETFRAMVIDDLYVIFDEATAEGHANLLDEYWLAEDLIREQLQQWQIQEEQRLFDQAHGAPKRTAAPVPEHTMHVRSRSKATLLIDDLRAKSRRMRDATITMQSYDALSRAGIARLLITGWSGTKTKFVGSDEIVDEQAFVDLTREIGKAATAELHNHISGLSIIKAVERGNSDSQLENELHPNGSPEQSDASEPSDGSLTSEAAPIPSTSNIEPTPSSESAETTGTSSTSTSASAGETLSTDAPQTVEG